jgi:hypothetical protein
MAVKKFIRCDFSLRVSTEHGGRILFRLAWSNMARTAALSSLELIAAMAGEDDRPPLLSVLTSLDISDQFHRWRDWVAARPSAPDEIPIARVTLQLDEPSLEGLPWERHLRTALSADTARPAIVRVSPVRPRAAQVPFTVPLRMLQIDRENFDLAACIRNSFYQFDPDKLAGTVRTTSGSSADFEHHVAPESWSTVDILHLGATATRPWSGTALLQTENPFAFGTLGWLMRATEAWQTRLVIMEPATAEDEVRTRVLAAALCARGGPAVLVGPGSKSPAPAAFYGHFYNALIHDTPVDEAFAAGLRQYPQTPQAIDPPTLFAGSGREELIRVSAPARKLYDLAEALKSSDVRRGRDAAGELWSTIHDAGESLEVLSDRFRVSIKHLENLHAEWPNLTFDQSERGGFIPSATRIDDIRRAAGPRPAGATRRREFRPVLGETAPRFANPSLSQISTDGTAERLDPLTSRIGLAEPLVLGIQIGPRDTFVPVLEAQAVLEEPFKWQLGHEGVWLTIGLSGIDFDVLGHPVQQLWLPHTGASEVVEFSVMPRRSGALMLRFCIYFGRLLLQSYRLAAWAGDSERDPRDIRQALAGILGVTGESIGNARYLGRMEYAASAELANPRAKDDVALSVFANDIEGRRAVTVWTGEDLAVSTDYNISLIGQQIRSVLDEVSGGKYTDGDRYYLFGDGPDRIAGSFEKFDEAMRKLAVPGWQLYCSILNKQQRKNLEAGIDRGGGIIHVGQALLENVIPWAMVYNREYDPDKKENDGLTAVHVTCAARHSAAEGGGLPAVCGEHPDCPLAPARLAEQRLAGELAHPDTVVCPRHFWGFRYRIELPPMQVPADGKPPAQRKEITATDPASLVIGFNASLGLAASHLDELATTLPGRLVKTRISGQSSNRDALMSLFASSDIDLLYLFCHARGGQADPTIRSPQLEFQEKDKPPGYIAWEQLDKFDWNHAPLVFLNGCNTAMFSPDALSPFIRTVVSSCGAAGAVGTEIPVFEQLAATFAKSFLKRFLDGDAAGKALLDARLEFLAQNNPLGLAYTLYAFSSLAIAQRMA